MKLMKRILAIVCTFVMIISMATGVNAVEQPSKASAQQTKGSITIKNAKAGERYKIYKILTLESYDKAKEAYSYVKNAGNDPWNQFVQNSKDYLKVNNDGYVTFVEKQWNSEGTRNFASKAMAYAKANRINATATNVASEEKESGVTVKFTGLDLGYYLVESSVGTACSIGTTDPELEVTDKHESPSVSKLIVGGADGLSGVISENGKKNSVNLGDYVSFEIKINVTPYTKNYVLHDTMDDSLEYSWLHLSYINLKDQTDPQRKNPTIYENTDFKVNQAPGDGCTFEISFTDEFYKKYRANIDSGNLNEITFNYFAKVKDTAPTDIAMPNKAHLTYGENSKTDEVETKTYTWSIPVYKYTLNAEIREDLAGAKFILSTQENPTPANALKFTNDGSKFRYTALETNGNTELESYTDGMIYINGLKSGTYYLKETKAPDGYNTLKDPIKIVVDGDPVTGRVIIKVNEKTVEKVEVQNNKGSLLPSTGGMGTTLIYVVGSILVLASGIVLFSKRKEGTN